MVAGTDHRFVTFCESDHRLVSGQCRRAVHLHDLLVAWVVPPSPRLRWLTVPEYSSKVPVGQQSVTEDTALRRAYANCLKLAKEHYENFPVASRLLPPRMRPHIAAVYAFARNADDFADEGDRRPEDRLALLDGWHERLRLTHAAGTSSSIATTDRVADDVFLALGHTMRVDDLPIELFEDLLSAFRQDVVTHRYETWGDLLDYCRRSANPVGRIFLRVAGYRNATLDRAADSVCSALQITNFLQDFGQDWREGRLYVPAEVHRACGAKLDDLDHGQLTPAWRDALRTCADRTRTLFADGRAVCDEVRGRLKFELRLTWLGGVRILDRLEQTGYDPLAGRPTLGFNDMLPLMWNALVWT